MDAGCVAHIVHKSVKIAAKRLAIDGRVIVGEIYTHFHTSSGRLDGPEPAERLLKLTAKGTAGSPHPGCRLLGSSPSVQGMWPLRGFASLSSVRGENIC